MVVDRQDHPSQMGTIMIRRPPTTSLALVALTLGTATAASAGPSSSDSTKISASGHQSAAGSLELTAEFGPLTETFQDSSIADLPAEVDEYGNVVVGDLTDPSRTAVVLNPEARKSVGVDRTQGPMGDATAETLVIHPDVSAGEAAAAIAEHVNGPEAPSVESREAVARACGDFTIFTHPAFVTTWSNPINGTCAQARYVGAERPHEWAVNFASNGTACGQFRAFDLIFPIETPTYEEYWVGAGCSSAGSTNYVDVPWGHVLAYQQWRGYSSLPPYGVTGNFR